MVHRVNAEQQHPVHLGAGREGMEKERPGGERAGVRSELSAIRVPSGINAMGGRYDRVLQRFLDIVREALTREPGRRSRSIS